MIATFNKVSSVIYNFEDDVKNRKVKFTVDRHKGYFLDRIYYTKHYKDNEIRICDERRVTVYHLLKFEKMDYDRKTRTFFFSYHHSSRSKLQLI